MTNLLLTDSPCKTTFLWVMIEYIRKKVEKANICNRQFQSSFTREADTEIPLKGASPFSSMEEITVDPVGVAKLLTKLNICKASGPDGLSARVLKECSSEIAPVLAYIFNESLAQGAVSDDWRLANVTPVFKKGGKIRCC